MSPPPPPCTVCQVVQCHRHRERSVAAEKCCLLLPGSAPRQITSMFSSSQTSKSDVSAAMQPASVHACGAARTGAIPSGGQYACAQFLSLSATMISNDTVMLRATDVHVALRASELFSLESI